MQTEKHREQFYSAGCVYRVYFSQEYSASAAAEADYQFVKSLFKGAHNNTEIPAHYVVAVGPKDTLTSPWSSNFVSILCECGVKSVVRVERYVCYDANSLPRVDELTQMKIDLHCSSGHPAEVTLSQLGIRDHTVDRTKLQDYSREMSLGMDMDDLRACKEMFDRYGRDPTTAELHDLANCNSEHSRHHLFRGRFRVPVSSNYGQFTAEYPESLMDLIRRPLQQQQSSPSKRNTTVVAFCDNASAIEGASHPTTLLLPAIVNEPCEVKPTPVRLHHTFTAETHNFPTGIAPFQGATTGTGGRIRDTQAIGRGGMFVAGTCGYCVGYIEPRTLETHRSRYMRWTPVEILLQASDGCSDYGNKVGEPVIQGFTRAHGPTTENDWGEEWVKPILFSGGIGKVVAGQHTKHPVDRKYYIARVGGPTYRIGIGGGAASSQTGSSEMVALQREQAAVQRGDAQLENRMDRWIRACITHNAVTGHPVIHSIHDQGAGGMGNVTKEIVENYGATVWLNTVKLGDPTLTDAEIWTAESQEQNTVLLLAEDIELAMSIASRERVDLTVVGKTEDTGRIRVHSASETSEEEVLCVDMKLSDVSSTPRKVYTIPSTMGAPERRDYSLFQPLRTSVLFFSTLEVALKSTLATIDVGSKRFLTTKVDRSVSGLVAQQQCVGPLQTPLADVAVIADGYFGFRGAATAIGERPLLAVVSEELTSDSQPKSNIEKSVRMAVGEMLTNLVWAPITGFEDIRCSGNWMWPASAEHLGHYYKSELLQAVKAVSDVMCQLGIAIDGGKDSVSMSAPIRGDSRKVDAPPTFVVSGYVGCTDIRKVVTPGFKDVFTHVWYVPLSKRTIHEEDVHTPDMDDPLRVRTAFETVQKLIREGKVLAGHDVSDGGLITTIVEMCFASERPGMIGFVGNLPEAAGSWINDGLGLVLEMLPENDRAMIASPIDAVLIGTTTNDSKVTIHSSRVAMPVVMDVSELRDAWELTATALERKQVAKSALVDAEHARLVSPHGATHDWDNIHRLREKLQSITDMNGMPTPKTPFRPSACVLRGEGSNGDREMIAALYMAGFAVHDVTTSDLTDERISNLDQFQLLVFVGGFTYSDVLGAASGWAAVLKNNKKASRLLQEFIDRPDTLVLGICNGFQLLIELGWITGARLLQNESKRFESRFLHVSIDELQLSLASSSTGDIWFSSDMTRMPLGVWTAHGEGRWSIVAEERRNHIPALYYVDETCKPTQHYPLNPNGSDGAIAGVTSDNGRILGMMPHPERSVRSWQLGWAPHHIDWSFTNYNTPWLLMFHNAKKWCDRVRRS